MSTIERERRVEFNDGMDELPSLDDDLGNLCDVLEGGDPRTAAILRRRYQKKGLLQKAKPAEPEIVKPVAPVVPQVAKVNEKQERKSWADMSTESEDEHCVESFGSEAEERKLAWDPIGQVEEKPRESISWVKVWREMTGGRVEDLVPEEAPSPLGETVLEECSPTGGAAMGYAMGVEPLPALPTVQPAVQPAVLPAGVVPVIPIQQIQPMMMFIPQKSMSLTQIQQTFQRDSFQRDSFQRDSFQRDSFQQQRESFQRDSFSRDSFQRESFQPESFQQHPEAVPRFHAKTAQLGHLSADGRTFTKTKSKGRLSIASTDSLYRCGVARYWVQFLSGELSNADGVGIVFSSQLPCPQNIQRIISIFANRTGRICMRADADVERSHVNIKAIELGDWLEVVCDFNERKVTFSLWPTEGNVSSATVDFSGRSDRFQRLSAQVPQAASGYLAVVMKHPNLTVTLGA